MGNNVFDLKLVDRQTGVDFANLHFFPMGNGEGMEMRFSRIGRKGPHLSLCGTVENWDKLRRRLNALHAVGYTYTKEYAE